MERFLINLRDDGGGRWETGSTDGAYDFYIDAARSREGATKIEEGVSCSSAAVSVLGKAP
jgi:hypothetical protein